MLPQAELKLPCSAFYPLLEESHSWTIYTLPLSLVCDITVKVQKQWSHVPCGYACVWMLLVEYTAEGLILSLAAHVSSLKLLLLFYLTDIATSGSFCTISSFVFLR